MKILDVGCGQKPKGDVNIDLFVGKSAHSQVDVINPKLIRNFIKADAHHLPFKDDCFSIVYASHLLEHLCNPLKALNEFNRVSNKFVLLKVPHANFYRGLEMPVHIFSWNKYTMKNLLEKVFSDVKVKTIWDDNIRVRNRLKSKILTLKLALFSIFWGRNELSVIAYVVKKRGLKNA